MEARGPDEVWGRWASGRAAEEDSDVVEPCGVGGGERRVEE